MFGSTAYSSSYYADVVRLERVSVPHIADWILQELHPKRVIDVGCGPGHLLQELADRGMEVFGVDVSDEAARLVGERGLPFAHVDITSCDRVHAEYFDLAISCEVAEHLKPEHAATFAACMVELADTVYVTAAEPMPNGETSSTTSTSSPTITGSSCSDGLILLLMRVVPLDVVIFSAGME